MRGGISIAAGGSRETSVVFVRDKETPLQRELRETERLRDWVRDRLYEVHAGAGRARATSAVAAAAAEEAYRLSDQMPEWCNETSALWRAHLARVWAFLEGDSSQHYPLSSAIADFLTSPLNHNEGENGPDDFDRPQTVASYSAVLSTVVWGVDFGVRAVTQIFDCLELKYGGEYTPERDAEVQREIRRVRDLVGRVVAAGQQGGPGLSPELLAAIRS